MEYERTVAAAEQTRLAERATAARAELAEQKQRHDAREAAESRLRVEQEQLKRAQVARARELRAAQPPACSAVRSST